MWLVKMQSREAMWNNCNLYDNEQQRECAMYIELKQTNIVPFFLEYVLMKFICDLYLCDTYNEMRSMPPV
jgi:hypothetical protein